MMYRDTSSSRQLAAAVAEALESRRLLASFIQNGTLYVDGTSGNDVIRVHDERDIERVTADINGASRSYAAAAIRSIVVRGLGGNDRLTATLSPYEKEHIDGITVNGGSGNDTIYHHEDAIGADFFGESGNDHLTFQGVRMAGRFDGGSGRDKLSLVEDGDGLDLRKYPTVEDGFVTHGVLYGNELANHLSGNDVQQMFGFGGNDTIVGGGGGSSGSYDLQGGAGNDLIIGDSEVGSRGDDGTYAATLLGGDGDDTLVGGRGADLLKGGAGRDTVDYSKRTAAVRVGLGTSAGDGAAGENDNAWYDIENVLGGSGSDWINGTGCDNYLRGNGGNDTILGGGGRDAIFGNAGNDRLDGGSSNDYVEGGDGNDTLTGGSGTDTLRGGAGDDWLYGRDGTRDTLDGGSGSDRAQRDTADYILSIESFI